MRKLQDEIRRILAESEIESYGFAYLGDILNNGVDELTHAISIGVRLNPTVVDSIANGPNQEYCEEYKAVNKQLDQVTARIIDEIKREGYRAAPIPASKRTDYVELRGEFPHKTAATRAGIGWIGKSSLLVTKRNGPRIRLATILTDCPLESDEPIEKSFCGKCTRCIDACPAGAIIGGMWNPGLERKKMVDVHRCDHWKVEKYQEYCNGHICGICVSVCPFGKRRGKKK